jgi:predicted TIM-barrel fold metal-dependent hydrolase
MRFVLAHAGGVLPALAGRISSVGTLPWVPNDNGLTPEQVSAQLANLYFDTALAASPQALLPVLETTTADHLVFGSDFPPAGVAAIEANLESLRSFGTLTANQVTNLRANALTLFPRLARRLAGR